MGGIFGWLCLWASWHPWRKLRALSEQSDLCECERCGRRWAMNNSVGAVLPWSTVSEFYAEHEIKRFGRPIRD